MISDLIAQLVWASLCSPYRFYSLSYDTRKLVCQLRLRAHQELWREGWA